MLVKDAEIERMASELLAEHGPGAARVAVERLNEMIDRDNVRGRDIWACVVHAIHEQQDPSRGVDRAPDPNDPAPRLAATI
jgi:hypothetical protein